MNWNLTDARSIDPITKDYVVSDVGFDQMDTISQRVYIALCKLTFPPKKTADIDQVTRNAIYAALDELLKNKLISILDISARSDLPGTYCIAIEWRNNTTGQTQIVAFD